MKLPAMAYDERWEMAREISDRVSTSVNERVAEALHALRLDHIERCQCDQCQLLDALRAALI